VFVDRERPLHRANCEPPTLARWPPRRRFGRSIIVKERLSLRPEHDLEKPQPKSGRNVKRRYSFSTTCVL
jgi:hypothetical protein